jgi:hypothetical protein
MGVSLVKGEMMGSAPPAEQYQRGMPKTKEKRTRAKAEVS